VAAQGARRAATRESLLDAAAECLVERGLAGFTTTEVILRSQRSTGALYSHFPAKLDLLQATVAHVFAQLRASFLALIEDQPDAERTLPGTLGLLWAQMSDPRLGAVFEAYTAARTDPAIQRAIEPAIRDHIVAVQQIMYSVVGDRIGVPPERVLSTANLAVFAMQGLALNLMAVPDPPAVDALLADLADLSAWAFTDAPLQAATWPSASDRSTDGPAEADPA
jgi:AcrR family transcriptional regulator